MSAYNYERLGPDKFQELCQTILIDDFPDLQCFPVGMADGGRDGESRSARTVAQVKFLRNPGAESAKAIIKTLEAEKPSIEKLIERGVEKYIFLTNGRASAGVDVGVIDQVESWLDNNLSVPALFMPRASIDRRLERSQNAIKMSYIEILPPGQALSLLMRNSSDKEQEERLKALKRFITVQKKQDSELKFKQAVEKPLSLKDVFVDAGVSIHPRHYAGNDISVFGSTVALGDEGQESSPSEAAFADDDLTPEAQTRNMAKWIHGSRNIEVGAAAFLCSETAQTFANRIIVEAGPGQGKSTTLQYVCQEHRDAVLEDLEGNPHADGHNSTLLARLPFKVDARDLAQYLSGVSPFRDVPTISEPINFENFVCLLVNKFGSAANFSSRDLYSVAESTPLLFAIDGLDEVASREARATIIEHVDDALTRLSADSVSIQVIITTRPTIFGAPIDFDKYRFVTVCIDDLNTTHVYDYLDKWTTAADLDEEETQNIRDTLREKIEEEHVRELTRNPMQLTILLSLMHSYGESLPSQRTELYGNYLDMFLRREAEKGSSNSAIRKNRGLLERFVAYLAWVLQSETEADPQEQTDVSLRSGAVTFDRLQDLARSYFKQIGEDEAIAGDLFTEGIERIFVLVQRTEGLFEFSVQPLREFLCAKYLHRTSDWAPASGLNASARLDRFNALKMNPFWANVCRFYLGFCTSLENAGISSRLIQELNSDDAASRDVARKIAVIMLTDDLLSEDRFAQKNLIEAVFSAEVVRDVAISISQSYFVPRLPDERARKILGNVIFENLKTDLPIATLNFCIQLLQKNDGFHLAEQFVEWIAATAGPERTRVLDIALFSGALVRVPWRELQGLIQSDDPPRDELDQRYRLVWMAVNHDGDFSYSHELERTVSDAVIKEILDGSLVRISGFRHSSSPLSATVALHESGLQPRLVRLEDGRIFAFGPIPTEITYKFDSLGEGPAYISNFLIGSAILTGSASHRSRDVATVARLESSLPLWSQIRGMSIRYFGESVVSLASRMRQALRAPEPDGNRAQEQEHETILLSEDQKYRDMKEAQSLGGLGLQEGATNGTGGMSPVPAGLHLLMANMRWATCEFLEQNAAWLNRIIGQLSCSQRRGILREMHSLSGIGPEAAEDVVLPDCFVRKVGTDMTALLVASRSNFRLSSSFFDPAVHKIDDRSDYDLAKFVAHQSLGENILASCADPETVTPDVFAAIGNALVTTDSPWMFPRELQAFSWGDSLPDELFSAVERAPDRFPLWWNQRAIEIRENRRSVTPIKKTAEECQWYLIDVRQH